MAAVLGQEFGADVALGRGEKPGLDLLNDLDEPRPRTRSCGRPASRRRARRRRGVGARRPTARDARPGRGGPTRTPGWTATTRSRSAPAPSTPYTRPGHTPGHYVFADRADGLLFAGDHVLPTITPSIGFTMPPPPHPLGDFMASLTKVRGLPDLRMLPAHGPVAPSSHARVDELLAHHEDRLSLSLAALASGPATGQDVARQLPWTRHEHALRRPRRLQPRHGRDGDQGAPRAAGRPAGRRPCVDGRRRRAGVQPRP